MQWEEILKSGAWTNQKIADDVLIDKYAYEKTQMLDLQTKRFPGAKKKAGDIGLQETSAPGRLTILAEGHRPKKKKTIS